MDRIPVPATIRPPQSLALYDLWTPDAELRLLACGRLRWRCALLDGGSRNLAVAVRKQSTYPRVCPATG